MSVTASLFPSLFPKGSNFEASNYLNFFKTFQTLNQMNKKGKQNLSVHPGEGVRKDDEGLSKGKIQRAAPKKTSRIIVTHTSCHPAHGKFMLVSLLFMYVNGRSDH